MTARGPRAAQEQASREDVLDESSDVWIRFVEVFRSARTKHGVPLSNMVDIDEVCFLYSNILWPHRLGKAHTLLAEGLNTGRPPPNGQKFPEDLFGGFGKHSRPENSEAWQE